MGRRTLLLAAMLALAADQAWAGEAPAEPFGKTWQACQDRMTGRPDEWIGWRRDFFNGYGDNFAYWSKEAAAPGQPAVLRTDDMIDGIVAVTTTYCFGSDGRPALARSVMTAPTIGDGLNRDAGIRREGWVYFGPDGAPARASGRIVDTNGKSRKLDDPEWQPARGCDQQTVRLFKSAGDVTKAYVAELGDIEGRKPAFKPDAFDWCAKAEFDPS